MRAQIRGRSTPRRRPLRSRQHSAAHLPAEERREGAHQHPLWTYDAPTATTAYYELDAIGNVRRLRSGEHCGPGFTEADCDLGGYAYTVFGKTLPPDEATPAPELDGDAFNQPLRWQGRWYTDLAGGLYDFRNRWWSPEVGAFLQADEFRFLSRTGTLWSWPGQNPVRWRDPSGRQSAYQTWTMTGPPPMFLESTPRPVAGNVEFSAYPGGMFPGGGWSLGGSEAGVFSGPDVLERLGPGFGLDAVFAFLLPDRTVQDMHASKDYFVDISLIEIALIVHPTMGPIGLTLGVGWDIDLLTIDAGVEESHMQRWCED